MIITITGEAWGTVSHSITAVWAKFHATTGHKHTGGADDAPVLPYSGLSGKPDTDLTPYTKIDGTRAFTGDQSMGSHKLTSVTDPGAAQDAATKNYMDAVGKAWAAWTPTLTWSGATPTGISTVARWTQSGRVVFFGIQIQATDSKGTTNLTVTLPVVYASNSMYGIVLGEEYVLTGTPEYTNPFPYLSPGSSTIAFLAFVPGINGKTFSIYITGNYEVA